MAAANIVVDKHSPDEFDKLSLPENLGDTTEIQQGRTYFLAGSVLGMYLIDNWTTFEFLGELLNSHFVVTFECFIFLST